MIHKPKILKRLVFLVLNLIMAVLPVAIVYAENTSTSYKIYELGNGIPNYYIEDLLKGYEENSITYRRNILDYQIQAITGTIADENYSDTNSQYLEVMQKISELNNAKALLENYRNSLETDMEEPELSPLEVMSSFSNMNNDYAELINELNAQITSIDMQLYQYTKSKKVYEINLSEARLQEDIADYYTDFQNLITEEAQKKLKYEFAKKCYGLILYKEQLDYILSYQVYLELMQKADNIKYRMGLVDQLTMDKDKTSIIQNQLTIDKNQTTFDTTLHYIGKEAGTGDSIKLCIKLYNTPKSYDIDFITKEFLGHNSGYHQLQNYIRSYQNYQQSTGTYSYAVYQQTELRIKGYQLQLEELEDSVEVYVKEAVKAYATAFQARDAALKELQVKLDIYNKTKIKLDYRRTSKIELQKALYEKELVEAAYYKSCYDIVVWQDILDYNIYGATPY